MQALPNEGAAHLYEAWRKPGLSFLHRPERPEQAECQGQPWTVIPAPSGPEGTVGGTVFEM